MLPKNMSLYLIFVLKILLVSQFQTHRMRPGATITMYHDVRLPASQDKYTTTNNFYHWNYYQVI